MWYICIFRLNSIRSDFMVCNIIFDLHNIIGFLTFFPKRNQFYSSLCVFIIVLIQYKPQYLIRSHTKLPSILNLLSIKYLKKWTIVYGCSFFLLKMMSFNNKKWNTTSGNALQWKNKTNICLAYFKVIPYHTLHEIQQKTIVNKISNICVFSFKCNCMHICI